MAQRSLDRPAAWTDRPRAVIIALAPDSGLNDYPIGPDRACDDRHLFSVQDALPHRPGRAWRHRPDGAVREMRPYLDANAAGRPAAARGRDFARERPAGPGAAALQSARPLCPAAPPPVAPAHGARRRRGSGDRGGRRRLFRAQPDHRDLAAGQAGLRSHRRPGEYLEHDARRRQPQDRPPAGRRHGGAGAAGRDHQPRPAAPGRPRIARHALRRRRQGHHGLDVRRRRGRVSPARPGASAPRQSVRRKASDAAP